MTRPILLFISTLFSIAAQAGGLNIKPGLWEIQSQTNVDGKPIMDTSRHRADARNHIDEIQKQMATAPPEKQQRMQAVLAESRHMGMTAKGVSFCLTQEQVNRSDVSHSPNNHCKTVHTLHQGDETTVQMHCDAPRAVDMVTRITRLSDTEWKSTTHVALDNHMVDSSDHGTWLKADCGDVIPFPSPDKSRN